MIHFHQVQKSVGRHRIFTDLTLFLPKASYTLLSGRPQSGKTTLVRLITAYDKPDQGTLQVDGIDIGSITRRRIPYLRRQIGMIAQTPALLEEQTVSENITVPLQLAGFERKVILQRLDTALEQTGLVDEQNTKVKNLHASLRQLVSAARATIHKPLIVVADDPVTNASATDANKIVDLLNKANESGATVLVTCANFAGLTKTNATSAVKLQDGSIQHEFNENTIT